VLCANSGGDRYPNRLLPVVQLSSERSAEARR
jgi:hypothetical protein